MLNLKPIPYRIWDKINKSFAGVRPYPTEDGYFAIEEPDNVDNDERYLISYQIRYKDKNGKDIFIGDIVKHEWMRIVVVFVVENDHFIFNKYYHKTLLHQFAWFDVEVIGNIFKNIDLIKDEEFKKQIMEQLK